MSIYLLIEQKIKHNIQVSYFFLRDDSAQHAGHASVKGAVGPTHFHLCVHSPEFSGLSRLAISRRIHHILAEELQSGQVHALTIEAKAG